MSNKVNELCGSFSAVVIDDKNYVILWDLYKITTISLHTDFSEAEQMAQRLNTVYNV